MKKPLIAITMGDPAGIGPELCLQTISDPAVTDVCLPVIFGDAGILQAVAEACDLPGPSNIISIDDLDFDNINNHAIVDCHAINHDSVEPGIVTADCGRASYNYIEHAVTATLNKSTCAVVTGPLNKESLNMAGIKYPGHTEILADLTGASRVCMMFAADDLFVTLATIHLPFNEVASQLTKEKITNAIELTTEALKRLGIDNPHLSICALNPHAGEQGLFGNEEENIICPAIADSKDQGYNVHGPIVPDIAFLPEKRSATDGYIAMYHDQGLIPFKMLAFDKGVNVTLGLPIIRTSVDHGTAFDIAWKGIASHNSMVQSILCALRFADSSD